MACSRLWIYSLYPASHRANARRSPAGERWAAGGSGIKHAKAIGQSLVREQPRMAFSPLWIYSLYPASHRANARPSPAGERWAAGGSGTRHAKAIGQSLVREQPRMAFSPLWIYSLYPASHRANARRSPAGERWAAGGSGTRHAKAIGQSLVREQPRMAFSPLWIYSLYPASHRANARRSPAGERWAAGGSGTRHAQAIGQSLVREQPRMAFSPLWIYSLPSRFPPG